MKSIVFSALKKLRLYGVASTVVCWIKVRWRSTPWERARHTHAMLSFYSRFIAEGDLCFDIGANLGERTEVFRRLGGTVVAVEPQDVCVRQLVKKYGWDGRVKVVPKALGEKEGEAEMMLSNAHTHSSLSKEWIDAVKGTGCQTMVHWDTKVIVPVTTLDKLIEEYGQPVFCKIDVEGFEFEVLKGLSQPIKVVSIEFHSFYVYSAINSINRLSSLGMIWFNYSVGESMKLILKEWVKADEICDILLRTLPDMWDVYGDVYATSVPVPLASSAS